MARTAPHTALYFNAHFIESSKSRGRADGRTPLCMCVIMNFHVPFVTMHTHLCACSRVHMYLIRCHIQYEAVQCEGIAWEGDCCTASYQHPSSLGWRVKATCFHPWVSTCTCFRCFSLPCMCVKTTEYAFIHRCAGERWCVHLCLFVHPYRCHFSHCNCALCMHVLYVWTH